MEKFNFFVKKCVKKEKAVEFINVLKYAANLKIKKIRLDCTYVYYNVEKH